MLRACAGLLLLSFAASGAEPSAQEQARSLVRSAKAAFDAGQFEEAANLLDQAVELAPTPATLYNLGRAKEKAGRLEAAVGAYRRYLDAAPDASDRGATEATIADLTQRIEQKVRLDDFESKPRIDLPRPDERRAPARTVRIGPWVVFGLGLVGLGGAVALGVSANNTNDHATALLNTRGIDLARPARDTAVGLAWGANAAYAVSGALVLAGVVWFLVGLRSSP